MADRRGFAFVARLRPEVSLCSTANGLSALFDGRSLMLGAPSGRAQKSLLSLARGLAFGAISDKKSPVAAEILAVVRQLARSGLLEYAHIAAGSPTRDVLVIRPQTAEYWPDPPPVARDCRLILSRFAFIRRRQSQIIVESPLSTATFCLAHPSVGQALLSLARPLRVRDLISSCDGAIDRRIIGLLAGANVLCAVEGREPGSSCGEDADPALAMWEFHDLLFHARSREGRHANITGGTYPHVGMISPLPAVRKRWPGKALQLQIPRRSKARPDLPFSEVMARRKSTREFDCDRPITLTEASEFLHRAARVKSVSTISIDAGSTPCAVELSARPYPSGGASYELELYLAVSRCKDLPVGFYHYDAGAHALARIPCNDRLLQHMLTRAQHAMGVHALPQILVTIAARFGRVSWKYRSLAYAIILKDVGVLVQNFYLVAAQMNLGACAIGSGDIELFAKMTGLDFHAEGSVGEFVLGRPE